MKTPIQSPKKKILILSSKGGYGHTAASLAIQEIFKDRYQFSVVYPIEEVNRFGIQSGENFYNLLLKNEWIRTTNFLSNRLAPLLFQIKKEQVESSIDAHLLRESPDLILSLVPFINYPASEAARKLNIPYLLVTTDNDLTNWVFGLHRVKHPSFRITIGRDHAKTRGLLIKNNIKDSVIETTGLPIHPSFFKTKDELEIKKEFGIPAGKPVICIMMGGAGGCGSYDYVMELRKMAMPLHAIVCTGNNRQLYLKLQELSKNHPVSLTVLQFTDKVASLMQVSNLIITKPGPGTTNEAMIRKLPILIDNTNSSLAWERVNREIVVRERIGRVIHSVEEIRLWVPKFLHDPIVKEKIRQAYNSLVIPPFAQNLERIMEAMLASSVKTPLAQFL
jgi:processive 1,2-diacylglycerol beta-glucosyltransferase